MARRTLMQERREQERLFEEKIQTAFRQGKESRPRFESVFRLTPFKDLRKKSKNLTESPQAWEILHHLLRHQNRWVNEISTWKPHGKSTNTLLCSLIRHLICKYSVPAFWYEVWFRGADLRNNRHIEDSQVSTEISKYCQLFVDLAQGRGMYKMVQDGDFPVGMTKKQCHVFLQQKNVDSVIHATRWALVQSFDGERRFAKALCDTSWGEALETREIENFRTRVIQWFCAQGMLDTTQIGPLIDYIDFCHRTIEGWTITGRTVTSLMRGMEQWHADLAAENNANRRAFWDSYRKPPPDKFESCGIENWEYHHTVKDNKTGNQRQEFHAIKEILTYKGLHEEGSALLHCVTSYAWNIERGSISIWSYSVGNKRTLTLELVNSTKILRQIRGYKNRMPTTSEMGYVQRWASEKGVLISPKAIGRGW